MAMAIPIIPPKPLMVFPVDAGVTRYLYVGRREGGGAFYVHFSGDLAPQDLDVLRFFQLHYCAGDSQIVYDGGKELFLETVQLVPSLRTRTDKAMYEFVCDLYVTMQMTGADYSSDTKKRYFPGAFWSRYSAVQDAAVVKPDPSSSFYGTAPTVSIRRC